VTTHPALLVLAIAVVSVLLAEMAGALGRPHHRAIPPGASRLPGTGLRIPAIVNSQIASS
jgi:hypothetical protein